MFNGLWYSIKKGIVQIFRNKGMSLASLLSITAMLLILALFFTLTVNVNYLTEQVKDEFDTIEVYLFDDTTIADAQSIASNLASLKEVAKVSYISKDEAMDDFKTQWGDNAYLLDGLSDNPLPNSLRIELSDISGGSVVAQVANGFSGVEDVRFYQDEVDKVLAISGAMQKGALIIIVFLVFVSIMVVSNTVKLTVMARQEEIEIMKYIGATNWFVRGPLFLEGMLIGFISTCIALGISSLLYIKLEEALSAEMLTLLSASMVEPMFVIENLAWIFVSLGISIGACGSIVSMRRFLKV